MLPRFHAPVLATGATTVTLDAEQSHHLVRVLRLRPGDAVRVFDGAGREWEGLIERDDRRAATVGALRETVPRPEAPFRLTVIAAVLRGPAMDALVHDAAMLGATRLVPVLSERVSVARREDALHAARSRWARICVAACRQCGRAVVPLVAPPVPLATALAPDEAAVRLWLAEPGLVADPVRRVDDLGARARAGGAALAIGPEGGWTAAELALAVDRGFAPWSLGPLVLRAETVPLAAMSILRYAWG